MNQIVDINQKLEEGNFFTFFPPYCDDWSFLISLLIFLEKSNIMNIFYQEFALSLFSPLFEEPPEVHSPVDTFLKSSLCDLLATFVDHQPQLTKLFIMKHNIIPKIFTLLKATEKNLKLGLLFFFIFFVANFSHQLRAHQSFKTNYFFDQQILP